MADFSLLILDAEGYWLDDNHLSVSTMTGERHPMEEKRMDMSVPHLCHRKSSASPSPKIVLCFALFGDNRLLGRNVFGIFFIDLSFSVGFIFGVIFCHCNNQGRPQTYFATI
jgi:hypothetical protein